MEMEAEVLVVSLGEYESLKALRRHQSGSPTQTIRNAPAASPHGDNVSKHRVRGLKAAANMRRGGYVSSSARSRVNYYVKLWRCGVARRRMVGWSDGRRCRMVRRFTTYRSSTRVHSKNPRTVGRSDGRTIAEPSLLYIYVIGRMALLGQALAALALLKEAQQIYYYVLCTTSTYF